LTKKEQSELSKRLCRCKYLCLKNRFKSTVCPFKENVDSARDTFDVPDRRKIPEADILMETRKGVAVNYAPAQTA